MLTCLEGRRIYRGVLRYRLYASRVLAEQTRADRLTVRPNLPLVISSLKSQKIQFQMLKFACCLKSLNLDSSKAIVLRPLSFQNEN